MMLENNYSLVHWILKQFPKAIIAGGFARQSVSLETKDIPATDVDLYFPNMEEFLLAEKKLQELVEENDIFGNIYRNQMICSGTVLAHNKELKIQLIIPRDDEYVKTFGTPAEIIDNFDLTCCQVAIYLENKSSVKITTSDEFIADDKARKLVIHHINCPVATMYRVMKYRQKGYRISAKEIVRVLNCWKERPNDYTSQITSLLESNDLNQEEFDLLERMLRVD